jgi:hypothetical protein
MIDTFKQRMRARSAALLMSIESRLDHLLIGWLIVAGLASAARVAVSPLHGPIGTGQLLPYTLLVLAPAASLALALRWFANGDRLPQPEIRLARFGRWRQVGRAEAVRNPLYGASGIMVSLLIGMLLNVPVRAAEYLATMPALSGHTPQWLATLHTIMTLDVVLLSSLYVIAFAAALRRVPLFPRLLLAVWVLDIAMQFAIARFSAASAPPGEVAVALNQLLNGNVKKVLISIAVWLPYLLLSQRVNVTYRHRVQA